MTQTIFSIIKQILSSIFPDTTIDSLYDVYNILIPYIRMIGIVVLNITAAAILFIFIRRTSFARKPRILKQIVIGIVFGGIAILATETSMPLYNIGINVNVRDAAPVVAGLVFGPEAGIIAGCIGGIERFFAVYWGAGAYTQIACSLGTVLSGLIAALFRARVLQGKRPNVITAFVIGIIAEIVHMFLVLVTHINDAQNAINIVRLCIIPMVLFVSLASGLSVLTVSFISLEFRNNKHKQKTINQKIQTWIMIPIIISFLLSSVFVYFIQTAVSLNQANVLLKSSISDMEKDLTELSDSAILNQNRQVLSDYVAIRDSGYFESEEFMNDIQKETFFESLAYLYGLKEIDVVDDNDIIIHSSLANNVGFDMKSSSRASEFVRLNEGVQEYVQSFGPSSIGEYDPAKSRKYSGVALSGGGYVIAGIDYTSYRTIMNETITKLTNNRHIGSSGYVIITDKNWKIISDSSTENNTYYRENANIIDIDKASNGEFKNGDFDRMYTLNLYGEEVFARISGIEEAYIIAAIPVQEAFLGRTNSTYVNFIIQIIIYSILFILIFLMINNVIIKKLDIVNDELSEISGGNLDTLVDVDSTEEFVNLSGAINDTVDKLKEYIDEAEKRFDEDLLLAKNIQTSVLPSVFPAYPGKKEFDIYATMNAAKEIGGDFYDFYMLGESRLCFVIADVSGKGIPAAMFMMQSKAMLKNYIQTGMNLGNAVTLVNNELCKRNEAGMFLTAFIAIIDISSGTIDYVNAGHNPPLIYRKDSGYEYLKGRSGFILAGMEDIQYKVKTVILKPGEKIFLYTDGVTEANDLEQNMYGEDRLKRTLDLLYDCDAKETLIKIKESIDEFAGEAEQFDDITMLMVDFKGDDDTYLYKQELEIIANNDNLDMLLSFLEENLEKAGTSMKFVSQMNIVAEEIFVNICNYAYKAKGVVDGTAWITFEYRKNTHEITLIFTDEGVPFNPLQKADPNISLTAEEREIGGLGIYIVKNIMDEVRYEYVNGRNVFILKKKL